MDIIYLLWWWVIPTIISAGRIKLKKEAILDPRPSHLHQAKIQPQYQPQADATGYADSIRDNLEINPEKLSEPQQAPSHQAIREVINLDISSSKESEPQVEVASNNLPNLKSSHGKENGPLVASGDSTNLEISPAKQSGLQVAVASSNATILELSPGNIVLEPWEPFRNVTRPDFETSLKMQEGPSHGSSDVTEVGMTPDKKAESRQVATNLDSSTGKESEPEVASSDIIKQEISLAKQSEPQVAVARRTGTKFESSPGKQDEAREPILRNATHYDSSLELQEGPELGSSDVTEVGMPPDKQAKSRQVATNLESSHDKQSEPQVAVARRNLAKFASSPGKQDEAREPILRNATHYESSLELQEGPELGSSDVTEVGMPPDKQAKSRQVPTNLDSSPSKQTEPQVASSDLTNSEISDGKQVAMGGSAMSPNIGENVAPADERPSRTEVDQGAPAPVAQPPSQLPTVQPPGDDKNKTQNGTSTNGTIVPQDMNDGDMKEGAKGKAFEDTVQHRNLKNVQTKMIDLGNDNGDYSCHGNRGPLRPLYERSKYFVDKENRYTYEEGRKECNKRELILAEIDSMSDFKALQLYYDFQYTSSGFNNTEDRYFIGLNDLENEGVYVRADGSPIQFQAYFTTQPDDKDGSEDCNAIGKDEYVQPVGMMDVSCFSKYHLLCMFPPDNTCINDTREANLYHTSLKHVGVHALMDLQDRAYSVSNFQLPWEQAFDYCLNQSMKMFDMDHYVTKFFFKTLFQYEQKVIADKIPVVQWWTGGRFKESHMDAAVFWENEDSVHSELLDQHRRPKMNFTFSGIFKWNNLKGADPTGKLGKRKDLCLSFGFQLKPDDTPFVRNTNCGLPCYFVCSKDHESKFEKPEITDEMK